MTNDCMASEAIRGIDWAQLRRCKRKLARFQGEEWAEGLLSLIDHIQDEAAEALGHDAVFKAGKEQER